MAMRSPLRPAMAPTTVLEKSMCLSTSRRCSQSTPFLTASSAGVWNWKTISEGTGRRRVKTNTPCWPWAKAELWRHEPFELGALPLQRFDSVCVPGPKVALFLVNGPMVLLAEFAAVIDQLAAGALFHAMQSCAARRARRFQCGQVFLLDHWSRKRRHDHRLAGHCGRPEGETQ